MKNIEVDYKIVRNGEVILDHCYATVGLTDKNLKEVGAFILDDHGSGELVDIPSNVYDRIMKAVIATAIRDMKHELKDDLFESDEVILQEALPMDLYHLLPEEVTDKIDKQVIIDYYSHQDGGDGIIKVDGSLHVLMDEKNEDPEYGLYYDAESETYVIVGEEESTKENTLYLTVSQKNFDAIMDGKKTSEEREIKETTIKKFLELDEDGSPFINTDLIDLEDPMAGDIYVWNDGKYPYFPNPSLRYLNLAVGYNKERDTALVELSGLRFKPVPTKKGIIPRFYDNGETAVPDPNGNLCFWCIDMLIKRVVECNRVKRTGL